MPKKIPYSDEEVHAAFQRNKANIRATSRELGVSRGAIKTALERGAREQGFEISKPISGGRIAPPDPIVMPLPKQGEVARYIITAAQNNTDCHVDFFENLVTYAEHVGARVMVGTFSYNKSAWSQKATKRDRGPTEDDRKDNYYDPIFEEFIADDSYQLAPKLIWCGEINISPTAKRPLSSLETYTGLSSGIFPHTKFALESVAGTADDGAKFNYTTGTATMTNYVEKKAGLQARFHHAYGALIVEVDHEGDWFVRQLNADRDGTFCDIAPEGVVKVKQGEILPAKVEAINWGDIHARVVDPEIYDMSFREGGIMDTLRPRHQLVHDVLDFNARNHHEIKSFRSMFERWERGEDNVRDEIREVKELLEDIARDYCMTVVVDSNHDNALTRWLEETDFKKDFVNAEFYLEAMLDWVRNGSNSEHYHTLHEALKREGLHPEDFLFLGPDDSFVLCDDGSGGIECGMHGHLGPNGSKGTPLGLSKMGRRANTGHTHSARIIDGLYVAGTMTKLRLSYVKGPSSWSHSFIVTYENGKRTIITCYNGKWRA